MKNSNCGSRIKKNLSEVLFFNFNCDRNPNAPKLKNLKLR